MWCLIFWVPPSPVLIFSQNLPSFKIGAYRLVLIKQTACRAKSRRWHISHKQWSQGDQKWPFWVISYSKCQFTIKYNKNSLIWWFSCFATCFRVRGNINYILCNVYHSHPMSRYKITWLPQTLWHLMLFEALEV